MPNQHTKHPIPVEERFWAKVDKRGPEGCWLWLGRKESKGYGQFECKGIFNVAHRFAYELLLGPIPEGLTLDHLCRNRACVNPAHLEPISNRENILRGNGLTARYARQTHCLRGHPFDLFNTHFRPDGRRRCRRCVRERSAGVSPAPRVAPRGVKGVEDR